MKAYKYKNKIICLEGVKVVEKMPSGKGFNIRIGFGENNEYFEQLNEEEANCLFQNIYNYMTANSAP